jgi:hypothetical protein
VTAEIAIANKHAVALAADSKVTIGGSIPTKTYDTVNKVFTLSKLHPVGVMIFGNAEFMEYPWETIIKLFRAEKGTTSRKHVENWSDDFQKYVEQFGKIDDSHIRSNVIGLISSWLYDIEDDAITRAFVTGVAIPSQAYTDLLVRSLKRTNTILRKEKLWLPKAEEDALIKKYQPEIKRAIKDVFGNAEPAIRRAAMAVGVSSLAREVASPQSSGYVIAGFGDDDMFPTFIEMTTEGYVGQKVKIRETGKVDISRNDSACIRAFAQKDMVQGFMNGADPKLVTAMVTMVAAGLVDSCQSVLDAYGDDVYKNESIRKKITAAAIQRTKTMIGEFQKESSRLFSNPIMSMVDLLPKDELANLAESLVSLTSLKRRVSRGAETVGGPIDVALISKGDGFVWIKRKHYFSTELNPQFIRNYMRGIV